MIQRQHAPQFVTPGDPLVRIAKVLSVQRQSHTVDLIFLNGLVVLAVPVATGWGGSAFGFAGLMAPYRDDGSLSQKTYPEPQNPVNTTRPAINTEIPRDIYAVVVSLDGSSRGDSGHVVVGFLYPQVSEMMFDAETPGIDGSPLFKDFVLFRHPSDFEAMVDAWGGFRIQHPAKGLLALINQPPWTEEETPPSQLDLFKMDYDKLYEIRANTGRQIPVHGKELHFEARIPKWFIITWEIEELGDGTVTKYPPDGPIEDQADPTPGAFGCSMRVELDNSSATMISVGTRITTVTAEYGGDKARVLRADGRLCEISPPFSKAPQVGETVKFTKIPIQLCGGVYEEFRNVGHMREEAYWDEPLPDGMTVIRGHMYRRTGELHDTVVEAGDLFETVHPSEETGGNIFNRADVNHDTSAGEENIMHNDAGALVALRKTGDIDIIAPGNINIRAGGNVDIRGALILENTGGGGSGSDSSMDFLDGFETDSIEDMLFGGMDFMGGMDMAGAPEGVGSFMNLPGMSFFQGVGGGGGGGAGGGGAGGGGAGGGGAGGGGTLPPEGGAGGPGGGAGGAGQEGGVAGSGTGGAGFGNDGLGSGGGGTATV